MPSSPHFACTVCRLRPSGHAWLPISTYRAANLWLSGRTLISGSIILGRQAPGQHAALRWRVEETSLEDSVVQPPPNDALTCSLSENKRCRACGVVCCTNTQERHSAPSHRAIPPTLSPLPHITTHQLVSGPQHSSVATTSVAPSELRVLEKRFLNSIPLVRPINSALVDDRGHGNIAFSMSFLQYFIHNSKSSKILMLHNCDSTHVSWSSPTLYLMSPRRGVLRQIDLKQGQNVLYGIVCARKATSLSPSIGLYYLMSASAVRAQTCTTVVTLRSLAQQQLYSGVSTNLSGIFNDYMCPDRLQCDAT